MYKVEGTTITLTRGDSLRLETIIKRKTSNETYIPDPTDVIRFRLKKRLDDSFPVLIEKVIPITDPLILALDPEDTKPLRFGEYAYDIELSKVNGLVDTFIDNAVFKIAPES